MSASIFETLLKKKLLPKVLTEGGRILTERGIASVDPEDFRAFLDVLTSDPLMNELDFPGVLSSDFVTDTGGNLPGGYYQYKFSFLTDVCPKMEVEDTMASWRRMGGAVEAGEYEYRFICYNDYGDSLPSDVVNVDVSAIGVFKAGPDGGTAIAFPDRFNSTEVQFSPEDLNKEIYRTDTADRYTIASVIGLNTVRLVNLDGSAPSFGNEFDIPFQVRTVYDDNVVHWNFKDRFTRYHDGFRVYRRHEGSSDWYLIETLPKTRLTWVDVNPKGSGSVATLSEIFSGESLPCPEISVDFTAAALLEPTALEESKVSFDLSDRWVYGAKGLKVFRSAQFVNKIIRYGGVESVTVALGGISGSIPIEEGSFQIVAGAKSGADDGSGVVTGTGILSGTVDYDAGSFTVQFDSIISPLVPIMVSFNSPECLIRAVNYELELFEDSGGRAIVDYSDPMSESKAAFTDLTKEPTSLDDFHMKITDMWKTVSVDDCPDEWLPYLGYIIGYYWREDWSFQKNRRALKMWSSFLHMKGSIPSYEWMMRQEGGRVKISEPGIDVFRTDISPLDGAKKDTPRRVVDSGYTSQTFVANPTWFRNKQSISLEGTTGQIIAPFSNWFIDTSVDFTGREGSCLIFDIGGVHHYYYIQEVLLSFLVILSGASFSFSASGIDYIMAVKLYDPEDQMGRYLRIPDGVETGKYKIAEAVDPITLNIPTAAFTGTSDFLYEIWSRPSEHHRLGNWRYYHHGVYDVATNVDPGIWGIPTLDLLHPAGTRMWKTYEMDSNVLDMDWFDNTLTDLLIEITPPVFPFRAGLIIDWYADLYPFALDGPRVVWADGPDYIEENEVDMFRRLFFSPAYVFKDLQVGAYDAVNDFWEFSDELVWGDRIDFQPSQLECFIITSGVLPVSLLTELDVPDSYDHVTSIVEANTGGTWDKADPGTFSGGTTYVEGVDYELTGVAPSITNPILSWSALYDTRVSSGSNTLKLRIDSRWIIEVTFSDTAVNPVASVVAEINAAASLVDSSLSAIASIYTVTGIELSSPLTNDAARVEVMPGGGNPMLGFTDYQSANGAVLLDFGIGAIPAGTTIQVAGWYVARSF